MNNLLFVLLFFTGCASLPPQSDSSSPIILTTPSPIPIGGGVVSKTITLKCDSSCTDEEEAQLPFIENTMNEIIGGLQIIQYFYTPGLKIDNSNGLSIDQIIAKLREPSVLTVNYYRSTFPSKANGYESASDFSIIHLNRRNVWNWSICDKAGLAAHEMSHTKKFFHNGNYAGPNQNTVPYHMDHLFEKFCKPGAKSFSSAAKVGKIAAVSSLSKNK